MKLREVLERQARIGERNFECGWWTKGWKELHYCYRRGGLDSRYSGDKWAAQAQNILWSYVLGHWKHHNGMVNRATEEEETRIERQCLEQRVCEVYKECPDVGWKRTIFQRTLRDTLWKSSAHLKNWLNDVETAIKVERWRKDRKHNRRNIIMRFIQTIYIYHLL